MAGGRWWRSGSVGLSGGGASAGRAGAVSFALGLPSRFGPGDNQLMPGQAVSLGPKTAPKGLPVPGRAKSDSKRTRFNIGCGAQRLYIPGLFDIIILKK